MHSINVDNVNSALAAGLLYLQYEGDRESSRNGVVLVSPTPVTTTYLNPLERVLFSPMRDANPFFHLMESLWMLQGRNDLSFPVHFNKNFASYSDNGRTVRGAYGERWRYWFGYDQLEMIANELIRNPESRRCVLAMWDATAPFDVETPELPFDAHSDLWVAMNGGKDVPCNTHAYFDVRKGVLNMTVCCRSNDIYWGAYGANAVHFSFLLEFMAAWVGVPVGVYRQMSNNYHVYTGVIPVSKFGAVANDAIDSNLYRKGSTVRSHTPLVTISIQSFLGELSRFFIDPTNVDGYEYKERFLGEVATPMYQAWQCRKAKLGDGLDDVDRILAWDWRMVCTSWIERRNLVVIA